MPYFVYKIIPSEGLELVKQLELVATHDAYRDAKQLVRELRPQAQSEPYYYKIMFAETELSAEEQLQQKRDKPILMEHER